MLLRNIIYCHIQMGGVCHGIVIIVCQPKSYLTSFGGETPFNKLWLILDLNAKLDLRLTKHVGSSKGLNFEFRPKS